MTHNFLSQIFEIFITIMVSVDFNFLKKKKLAQNGEFSHLTGPRGLQCHFQAWLSKALLFRIQQRISKVFFQFILIYFSLAKKSTREKRES